MKKSVIIFDIDATAIDSPQQKLPTKRLVAASNQVSKKYFLCAATGRVWSFAEPVLKGMQLSDPCIISGGTQICNPSSGEILWQYDIDSEDLHAALGIFKQFSEYKILFNDYTREDYLYGGLDAHTVNFSMPVYFLEQIFVPQEIAPKILDKLSKISGIASIAAVAQRPGMVDIHVTNAKATKEHSIAELLNMLNVDRKNSIGVGDGHNDVHLFKAVGHKVAMDNAVEELKAGADLIIGDVKDDGFAAYLESLAGE